MPKWLKTIAKIVGALVALLLVILIAVSLYVSTHRQKVLALVTTTLNKNIDGSLVIGSMNPTFFKGFPDVSLTLNNVTLKDKKWEQHHHTLLTAKALAVSVNTAALLRGVIQVNKIGITDASIDLFTDSTGYSNTAVFKKSNKKPHETKEESESSTQFKQFSLNNVNFTMNNQKASKLFQFAVDDLTGNMNYPSTGWHTDFHLKTLVKSLSFNTKRGSFIKDKTLDGPFSVTYTENNQVINIAPQPLKIGEDDFTIGARFNMGHKPVDFVIDIAANELLWKHASALLAPNITQKLNMFDLKNPLAVKCTLGGSFAGGGDPSILVTCKVKSNVLSALGGEFTDCSFDGIFTNNYINGMGLSDANSAIKIYHLNAKYKEIPITIDTGIVNNLNNPVGQGTVRSKFDVQKVNNVLGTQTLRFTRGDASLKLAVKANIVDFRLYKPEIGGLINIEHADASYVPRNLNFKNTAISINFAGNNLLLNNIRLQSGSSIVYMQGRVNNFLNLYYNAPEKIVINWQIRSPQLFVGEFLGFLHQRRRAVPVRHTNARPSVKASANAVDQFNDVFENANADMHMSVANLHYKKFLATDFVADLLVSADGITLRNASARQAGGTIQFSGAINQNNDVNHFAVNTTVTNANVRNLFYSFDNFGLDGLTYKNLTGYISAKANVDGNIKDDGSLVPRSVNGVVNLNLKKGSLINFGPIKSVGKYAFPFRNLDNITFDNLNAEFDIRGEKINIKPMQINSSLLNLDVAGVYSLGKGTNIALDVPLRNPGKDKDITDKKEKEERRMKGIVLHLLATDGEKGIKIKWNKNHDKGDDKDPEKK